MGPIRILYSYRNKFSKAYFNENVFNTHSVLQSITIYEFPVLSFDINRRPERSILEMDLLSPFILSSKGDRGNN